MATELTYLPHLKTDAEHKAEERQSEHQQKLRDAAPELLEAAELHEAALAEPDHDKRETMLIEAGKLRRAAIAKAKS